MRIDGVACATAILVVSVWTSAVWAQAQTGAPAHGHDQASAAQGMQPPKTVLEEVTDTIAKMPQHEVRVVTATLPAGVTGLKRATASATGWFAASHAQLPSGSCSMT